MKPVKPDRAVLPVPLPPRQSSFKTMSVGPKWLRDGKPRVLPGPPLSVGIRKTARGRRQAQDEWSTYLQSLYEK